jgi:hypothetical protein
MFGSKIQERSECGQLCEAGLFSYLNIASFLGYCRELENEVTFEDVDVAGESPHSPGGGVRANPDPVCRIQK